MKNQIRSLIAEGKTEEALELLATVKPNEATLLMARYRQANREYHSGMLDTDDFRREMARINAAAVEFAPEQATSPIPTPSAPTVFISYNHADAVTARRVRDFLKQHGIRVIMDEDNMPAGMDIWAFIQQSVRACDAVISIVSAQSLLSGWVGQESAAALYAVWLSDKQFIPLRLDRSAFDIDFQIEAQKTLRQQIAALDAKIEQLRHLGGDARAFEAKRARLYELQSNLGRIVDRLNSVLALDISEQAFERSMKRVLDTLRKGT